jgi:hypothetical protein
LGGGLNRWIFAMLPACQFDVTGRQAPSPAHCGVHSGYQVRRSTSPPST